jgi:hypothetical protein
VLLAPGQQVGERVTASDPERRQAVEKIGRA